MTAPRPDKPQWQDVKLSKVARTLWGLAEQLVGHGAGHKVMATRLIDVTGLHEWRQQRDPKPTWTSLVVKALAVTMSRHPVMNQAIIGPPGWRRMVRFEGSDIAVAIEVPTPNDGVEALPHFAIIRSALDQDAAAISTSLRHCVEQHVQGTDPRWRALQGFAKLPTPLKKLLALQPTWSAAAWSQARGSACWVNSPARHGADQIITVWPWPITVTFGLIQRRPWVQGDAVVPRMTMPLAISFDRRIHSGGPGARMLAALADTLSQEDPASWAGPQR